MKTIILILILTLTNSLVFSQCNCETINRDDGAKIVQCNAMPVAYDNNTQVGVASASNGQDKFVTITIRFKSTAQNISGNLSIRLADNNMMTFELVNAQLAYIGNSQVANAVFLTNSADIAKLKKSKLKTITFKLKDGLTRTYQATSNSDVLVNQVQCL